MKRQADFGAHPSAKLTQAARGLRFHKVNSMASSIRAIKLVDRGEADMMPAPLCNDVARSVGGLRRPIEVCLTIDTEFSIGGAFTYPLARSPVGRAAVDCMVDGTSHGLEFILRSLRQHGIGATFFVEALQASYFGDKPMRDAALSIASQGHDVQLHLHPEWRAFEEVDWPSAIKVRRPNDACSGRSLDEMCELISIGQKTFKRWGIAAPSALRTGSFKTDRNVYDAMRHMGLPIGSNLGVGLSPPEDPTLHFRGGLHRIGGIVEVPATTYQERLPVPGAKKWRVFSIAGTSSWEARSLLDSAYEEQISPIIVLTHPFEFIKRRDAQFRKIAVNNLAQKRFMGLCEHLAENPAMFAPVKFSDRVTDWQAREPTINPFYTVGSAAALVRRIQNKANDLIWSL